VQVPGKIQHILCTGNLCGKETNDWLKTLAVDLHVVKGDLDEVRQGCRNLSSCPCIASSPRRRHFFGCPRTVRVERTVRGGCAWRRPLAAAHTHAHTRTHGRACAHKNIKMHEDSLGVGPAMVSRSFLNRSRRSPTLSPVRLQGAYPDQKVVTVGDFRIGLCHGHQIVPWGDRDVIAMHQRALGVDIMITGATHKFEAFEADGKFYVNPGSATGAYSSTTR